MLVVDAAVGPSTIDGLGLIAKQFVPAGAKVWIYDAVFDIEFPPAEIARLAPAAQAQILKYGYLHPETGTYVLCGDDARFTNHADAPNTRSRDDHMYATRDIQPGEEITCDYAEFEVRYQNGAFRA